MKQRIYSILSLMAVLAGLTSCQDVFDSSPEPEMITANLYNRDSQYNKDLSNFAIAVSKAVRNSNDFREFLIAEENLRSDGDFDVILKHIKEKKIVLNDTKANSTVTAYDLLSSYVPAFETKSGSPEQFLAYLEQQYPSLQISVPVLGDQWDGDYIPVVAFIPEGFKDGDAFIPGFDSNGQMVAVDAVNLPDNPVVVICMNEREAYSFNPDGPDIPGPVDIVEAPYNLNGTITSEGIMLSWDCDEAHVYSYKVYRRAENESDFSLIGSSNTILNRTFVDHAISANEYYYYYVTVSYQWFEETTPAEPGALPGFITHAIESLPSNIITIHAPTVLNALSSFEAVCAGTGIELRWNNDGITNCGIQINYQDPMNSMAYMPLTTTTGNSNFYQFNSPIKGRRVVYQAYRTNAIGNSDPVYDYIYPPYRNVDALSPVYLQSIYINNVSDIESWVRGDPEFQLKIFGVNGNGQTVELNSGMNLDCSSRANSHTFNRKLYDWMYSGFGGWHEALTFYMEERDDTQPVTFTANAKATFKLPWDISLEAGAGIQTTWTSEGGELGSTYLLYYQDPQSSLTYPNYNVTMNFR